MSDPDGGIETRGGQGPTDWRVRKPPPNPDASVFDGGFVMAQPDDDTPPDDMVIAQ